MSWTVERQERIQRVAPLALTAFSLVVLCAWIARRAVQSRGYYWADDYSHLLLSRQAIHHPTRLLDVWGRPIMTAVYIPGSLVGDVGARVTSLLLAGLAAVLCVATVRRLGARTLPAVAALFLLAQPLPAMIAYSALPEIVFSTLLALALFLDASGHPRAAAFTVSLLPLARVEGLVVVVVWCGWSIHRKRFVDIPLLAIGFAAWAIVGGIVYADPRWIQHDNPYGILGTIYKAGGWQYGFKAAVQSCGAAVLGIALVAAPHAWRRATLALSIAVALFVFYLFVWTAGAFNTLPTPVYLVSLAVPIAIASAVGLDNLLKGNGSLIASALALLAFAVLAESFGVLAVGAVVLALVSAVRAKLFRAATTFALIGFVAVIVALPSIEPHSLKPVPGAMKKVAAMKNLPIVASENSAYDWYSGRNTRVNGANALARAIRQAPPGTMFVADSDFTGSFLIPLAQTYFYGIRPILTIRRDGHTVEVLVKVTPARLPATSAGSKRGP